MESSANLMYQRLFPKKEISYDFNATMAHRWVIQLELMGISCTVIEFLYNAKM